MAQAACIAASVLIDLGIERAAIGWSRSIMFRRGNEVSNLAKA